MFDRTGIMVVNLGSPAQPTPKDIRKYLHQFLTDRRVIALSPLLWLPVLHGIILRKRPKRSALSYQKIWGRTKNGAYCAESPLVVITREQAEKLENTLPDDITVEPAMRYGQPSIKQAFANLEAKGCKRVMILPLYPQYADATVASVYDELANVIGCRTNYPSIRFLCDYHDDPEYIKAIEKSLRVHLAGLNWQADKILFSFHGLPLSAIENGDPYEKQCRRSFELLCENLSDLDVEKQITFQSRFGIKKWLEPYTLDVLRKMVSDGYKKVVVITPGFSTDSLETLEELGISAKEDFISKGGEKFSCVPCLNAQDIHIEALVSIIQKFLLDGGYTETKPGNTKNVITHSGQGMFRKLL